MRQPKWSREKKRAMLDEYFEWLKTNPERPNLSAWCALVWRDKGATCENTFYVKLYRARASLVYSEPKVIQKPVVESGDRRKALLERYGVKK